MKGETIRLPATAAQSELEALIDRLNADPTVHGILVQMRGMICGLTRGSSAAHIARATLEGIALQIVDLADAMVQDAGRPLGRLRVDGGASMNALLMQLQSDLLDVPIDRPSCVETTALGAAYLAGLAVGVFADLPAVARAHRVDASFTPVLGAEARAERVRAWRTAVRRARSQPSS
jgi:glycerol kinase